MSKTTKVIIPILLLTVVAGLVALMMRAHNKGMEDTPEYRAQVIDTLTASSNPKPDQKVIDSLSAPAAPSKEEGDILKTLQAQ
ncbi:MAG TPA: hypothetical protein VHE10_02025 [Candidatus Paceibacterota bacterium]|nr:hypothetical protein [Candidatus Paceibacterota bacterium]